MNQKTASAPAAENKMGTMPIGRLLFNMSLPMMVSMLVQALYNIVDSIFVANCQKMLLPQFLLPSRYRCFSSQLQPVPALV